MHILRLLSQLSIFVGMVLSIYACAIKVAAAMDPEYAPHCDISEEVSCSKVMNSEFGHMLRYLGLVANGSLLDHSNSFYGAIYYAMCGTVSCMHSQQAKQLLFYMSLFSMAITVGLAYIMYVHIKSLCLICLGTYICNITFLLTSWLEYRNSTAILKANKKR